MPELREALAAQGVLVEGEMERAEA
jgi:hypothetical protein